MKPFRFIIALGVGGYLSVLASAQAPPPPPKSERPEPAATAAVSPCPKVEIQAPGNRILREGQPVGFGLNISGGDPNVVPTIVWNVSAGSILSGQGTRSIQVDTAGTGQYREIVADIWLGGYSGECTVQANATVKVVGPASKFDEFGDLHVEKENERLTSAVMAISQNTDNILMIAYAGRNNIRGYASTALRRMKTYLGTLGVPSDRVGTMDGGFREEPGYEIWVVPVGAETPKPTPTIDRKDIVFPKTTPSRTTPAKKP